MDKTVPSYTRISEPVDKKIIRCVWVEETGPYGHCLEVVYSNHPRFVVGSRFDWGFAGIATKNDGYELQIAAAMLAEKSKGKGS